MPRHTFRARAQVRTPEPSPVTQLWLRVPLAWRRILGAERQKPYFHALADFLAQQRVQETVFPPQEEEFTALKLVPPQNVRVVILGQDPYHGPGQAHGLAFSVRPGVRVPPSLRNVFKELSTDLGVSPPASGDLTPWAQRGVLLLNTVLTVVQGRPGAHAGQGWEQFTDAVLAGLLAQPQRVAFILWGNAARAKAERLRSTRSLVVESAHPSPLSARRFFGSRPFSRVAQALDLPGLWELPA